MHSIAVEVNGMSKQIKGKTVLDHIDLQVPAGSVCGITGPNGSGKSMLLRVITGLVRPTSGQVIVLGRSIGREAEFAPDTGALIDIPGFLPRYSGIENLKLLAMIRNMITETEIAEALRLVGLDPNDKRHFRTYSTGMRQRLGIAQAIMEHPRLLILDEPTRGIDEAGHQQIYDLIRSLRQQGITMILTSHYENELQGLCNDVYVMNQGRLSLRLPQFSGK